MRIRFRRGVKLGLVGEFLIVLFSFMDADLQASDCGSEVFFASRTGASLVAAPVAEA